jgi:putative ABC transport system permease protein
VKALDRKLLRDLWRMRIQAMAIALVVASGVALFIATATAYRSLRLSEDRYYETHRFAHLWARMASAPESVVQTIAGLPDVAAVEGRLASEAVLDVPGLAEPATGLLLSIPPVAGHALNDLYLRAGRHVEPGRSGEVLVSDAFAEKNALGPGSTLTAVVKGRHVVLRIVGVALSPEYVMPAPPAGILPDDRRFGVFWMARAELTALLAMPGAINEVSVRLSDVSAEPAVALALDRILEPYGGRGAFGRGSQPSHVMLEDHIIQLEGLAIMLPAIFLLVAAFLVNVVVSRLTGLQRMQIGMLKAFGYSRTRIAAHYLAFAVAIAAAGCALGLPIGMWLGRIVAEFYGSFFRFPVLVFRLEPAVVLIGLAATFGASVLGVLGTLVRIVTMPPVVAMSAAAPSHRSTVLDRLALPGWIAPIVRMIVRNISRQPVRSALTAGGLALALAILVLGDSSADSITRIVDAQYHTVQREDVSVVLPDAAAMATWRQFESLPGVRVAEPHRDVPARIHVGGRTQDVTVRGLPPTARLRRIVDTTTFAIVTPPTEGVLISTWFASRLGIRRGDEIAIEIREGRRRTITARVVGLIDDPAGASVYQDLAALGRTLGEPETYTSVNLLVDPARERELYAVLKRAPQLQTVQMRRGTLANFLAMSDTSLRFIRRIEIAFSIIIAFGVVYNAARIAVAERSAELATMRVLGFTRGEISFVLLGEIAALTAIAVPIGYALGYKLSAVVAAAMSSDRFRMPVIVEPSTYASATLVFAAGVIGSALLVRSRLDRLDLVAVLKARE